VDGEESPFNLVLLLDCSTSTLTERFTLVQAAKQFVSIARPQDRVAVYVLSDTYLQVLSRLTDDRKELLRKIEDIPPLSGSTPLYDAVALSYAQELAGRRWERNALIVISDGIDNQILPPLGRIMPSKTPFADLKKAAGEMNAVIYPIYLDAFESPRVDRAERRRSLKEKARAQLEELAAAAGGRVFRAPSFRALEYVYGQVAQELRSVYSIGYYPLNQQFNGEWRGVEVKVERRGTFARTRPGYYAW
jgi:VWFA-related protein